MNSTFWVGQKPASPLTIVVYDDNGTERNLSAYTDISLRLIGPGNEEIDTAGGVLQRTAPLAGRLTYFFPTDRSLFKKRGDYLAQIVLRGAGAEDYTNTVPITVREAGKVNY